jgi:hypothetical protein
VGLHGGSTAGNRTTQVQLSMEVADYGKWRVVRRVGEEDTSGRRRGSQSEMRSNPHSKPPAIHQALHCCCSSPLALQGSAMHQKGK